MNRVHFFRMLRLEQHFSLGNGREHCLSHTVMTHCLNRASSFLRQRLLRTDPEPDTALKAEHNGQTAVARDVSRLRRPRRNCAEARHHEKRMFMLLARLRI